MHGLNSRLMHDEDPSFPRRGPLRELCLPAPKKQRAPEGTLCRKDAFCEKLLAAYFCAAMPCWASENSSTSTEMLCLIGFHWHFFTRATSAMGTYVSMKNGKVNM